MRPSSICNGVQDCQELLIKAALACFDKIAATSPFTACGLKAFVKSVKVSDSFGFLSLKCRGVFQGLAALCIRDGVEDR